MSAVDPRDVGVVIQGAMTDAVPGLVAAIRRHLPGASVLLSTWQGAATSGLAVDEVLHNVDPGALPCHVLSGGRAPDINCNRMVRSTLAGLRALDRPLAVKLRTDCRLDHAGVLSCLAELPPAVGDLAIFERKVGISSVYTRHPGKSPTGLFHPADTVQFGLTADLVELWDVPLMTETDAGWFLDPAVAHPLADTSPRFYNEQHVFLAALRRRHPVDVESRVHRSSELEAMSNRALCQNFVVVEPWASGLRIPRLERHLRWHEDPTCVMTTPLWGQLCDGTAGETTDPATESAGRARRDRRVVDATPVAPSTPRSSLSLNARLRPPAPVAPHAVTPTTALINSQTTTNGPRTAATTAPHAHERRPAHG